jgi:hypothetical protein
VVISSSPDYCFHGLMCWNVEVHANGDEGCGELALHIFMAVGSEHSAVRNDGAKEGGIERNIRRLLRLILRKPVPLYSLYFHGRIDLLSQFTLLLNIPI